MVATNMDQLEGMISSSTNKEYPDYPPTEIQFDDISEKIRQLLEPLYPVTDDEFDKIKRRLKEKVVVKMDLGTFITDKKHQHKSWLPARRADLDFYFWKRYKMYLEEVKGWNSRVTGSLDRVSDEIVDLLGDPKSSDSFQRRGLVLGDVQSGKTANYTAICNKAADTGYNVIIILAGTMENLRQQTQERLDAEFSGRKSEYLLNPKGDIENIPVGVGKYGHEKRIESFTSVVKDFDKNILRQLSLSLEGVNNTVIFVIKKNKSILNNLIRWLKSNNADARGLIYKSLLLIDDEADNASVNTNDPEKDPTAINKAIRGLLKLFRQASYLGITATPYANIFINPDSVDEMTGDDLFPRDFIYTLSPPTNYIGAEDIFGGDEQSPAKYKDALKSIYAKEMDAFFPFNHKKEHTVTELTPSMIEAMAYFLLATGIRNIRGDSNSHHSMMIHTSRFTNVQDQIRDLAGEWIIRVRSDLQNYASLSERESEKISSIAYLKAVWEKHELSSKAGKLDNPMPWHQFLTQYLYKSVAPINVRAVNQKSGSTSLDYFNHKEDGLRVIAVGGNSLSRGLTLEGLCVSYFYRRSNMYDTLLQMGRWFGYRPNYDDLFKIWISSEAIDWYGYITVAAEELKLEVARMKNANLTPMDFGLKVRQDPASLIVTAKNKMRAATYVKRPITVSGRLLETPRLKSDTKTLNYNEEAFIDFVNRLSDVGMKAEQRFEKLFWENVHKDEIEQLLRDFKTHPWQLNFQGAALADFIRDDSNLDSWDVYIAQGSGSKEYILDCGNGKIKIAPEIRTVKASGSQICISGTKMRVGAGGATKVGLNEEQKKAAETKFKIDNPKVHHVPDKAYLCVPRNPILILHVIEVDKAKSQIEDNIKVPDHLFALGIGIPANGKEKTANYMVNPIELRGYNDFIEDEGDEE